MRFRSVQDMTRKVSETAERIGTSVEVQTYVNILIAVVAVAALAVAVIALEKSR